MRERIRYWAIWRAFQTAEAVSVGEVTSWPSPSEARCWLISDITWESRLPLLAGHDEAGVQSPVWRAAATGFVDPPKSPTATPSTAMKTKSAARLEVRNGALAAALRRAVAAACCIWTEHGGLGSCPASALRGFWGNSRSIGSRSGGL